MTVLRVASYNIRAGLGADLRRDAARVLRAIDALEADIVALQEADFRLGTRPAALPVSAIAGATGLVPMPVDTHPESLGWHGNALLLRRDIRVRDHHLLSLPGLEPRGALIADLAIPGMRDIRVVALHLGLLRSSRRKQLSAIKVHLVNLPPAATLWMGDFNERSVKVGLGRLLPQFQVVTPGATYPVRRPRWPLDRFAHSDRLVLTPLPVPQPLPGDGHASDHRPIVAELSARST
ncbi:endonuclease/exonuclease/phosphatase family protein [Tropicimonas sp. S265A]|uniref:endonuclease/exonuclease/phosphatase family protein n=1 Tax=Tropicimonas sp. S265A TaxID=3415134 RepID=UPI003C7BE359